MSLFADTEFFSPGPARKVIYTLQDADLVFIENFFSKQESDRLYSQLLNDIKWMETKITVYGKEQFDNPHPTPVKAGEAIFHHPLALHGSGENRSNNSRRAFVINAFADGVLSDSNEPLLEGVPVVKKGNKMEGQFFPLLFEGLREN